MTVSVMLDLETWGKRPGCDIRSIGAVVFDPVAGTVSDDTFYIATENPTTYYHRVAETDEQYKIADEYGRYKVHAGYKYPLHRDLETIKWWNDQSPESQAAFENPDDLRFGLLRFSHWLEQICPDNSSLKLWANDPHFDMSILESAYHVVGLPVPWHYRAPRSMKTATDLAGLTRDEYVSATVPHHALHDAIAQALTICKCYDRLGLVHG